MHDLTSGQAPVRYLDTLYYVPFLFIFLYDFVIENKAELNKVAEQKQHFSCQLFRVLTLQEKLLFCCLDGSLSPFKNFKKPFSNVLAPLSSSVPWVK